MRISLKLLRPFSDIVGKKELEVELEDPAGNMKSLLDKLSLEYPRFGEQIFDESGELDPYVNVFVNDKPLSILEGMDTKLRDGDAVLIFFPISGGAIK
jgi:MoaD family protein